MKEQAVYVGVDVAKASLEVAWAGQSRRVPNDVLGRNALVKHLGQIAGEVQVICEASGGYERGLVQALQRSGIKISLVQASRVRQYARASGILAKTDSMDAHLLCRFGEALRPEATTPPKPQQDKLRELETQRRHLGRLLVAQQNRSAQLTQSVLLRLNKSLRLQIQKQIDQIDLLIGQLVAQSEELSSKAQKLTAVAGVGPRDLQPSSWRKCPNWENSIGARRQPSQDWLPLIATAARPEANAPSLAAVAPCAAASIWPL